MSAPVVEAPDTEAWAHANLRDLPGVTSFSYTASQLDRAGWITATFLQVDARSARRTAARDTAERARRRILGLASASWPEGAVCFVGVVEAPFWLPDDDGQPRYVARYEIRAHPLRPSPPAPRPASTPAPRPASPRK